MTAGTGDNLISCAFRFDCVIGGILMHADRSVVDVSEINSCLVQCGTQETAQITTE